MRIGVVYPQTEYGNDPAAVRDYAQTAEALGFAHILAYDHVLGANPERPGGWRGPYTHEHPFQEVFVLFSFMAAVTRHIGLVTGILILPQRQTALVAKQAATLDVLSSGRLRLGVAVGWNPVEFVGLGEDFHVRGRRIESQVELLRRLWTEPLVTARDEWHDIPDAGLNPLPCQRPIPIWFGGHADKVLRRTARIGDGWLPNYATAEDAAPHLTRLDAYLAEAGRARADLGIEPRLSYADGDPDTWRGIIDGWAGAGATHLTLNTMGRGFDTPDQHLAAMRRFAESILES